jgi:2-polyprenyl-3-methyl-5-hydroxy-6-metoxy-1,4-benzoquinol methylase
MIELARQRLAGFGDRAELVTGDFLSASVEGSFDVVVALGFFDYTAKPEQFIERMYGLCAGGAVAIGSFPRWTWHNGPTRHIRYEWIYRCPIFNYWEQQLRSIFRPAGFSRVELDRGSGGFLVSAWRDEVRTQPTR